MANRRMLSKDIVCSDAFVTMSLGAQALYVQIVLDADDKGFCSSPVKLSRSIGATVDDLAELINKRFLLAFDSGIVCVKHWLIQNKVQPTRDNGTKYQDELSTLYVKDNGAYTDHVQPAVMQPVDMLSTTCQQTVDKLSTQVRLGKVRLEECVSTVNVLERRNDTSDDNADAHAPKINHPSEQEVAHYFRTHNLAGDSERFYLQYAPVGWFDAHGNAIENWKLLARRWSKNEQLETQAQGLKATTKDDIKRELADIDKQLDSLDAIPDIGSGPTITSEQFIKSQLVTRRNALKAQLEEVGKHGK